MIKDKIIKDYENAKEVFYKESQEAFEAPTLEEYQTQHSIAYKKFEPFKIAYKQIQEPNWEDLPDYGDHMTLEEFVGLCECGGFINYDGFGEYASATQTTNITISPSDVTDDVYIKDKYTHVVWFNK